jgi:threonine/homoserine/homoserine lactone efflux protein
MQLQDWLLFAAVSAAFLSVPGRAAKRIGDCRRAGGAKLAGLTVLGCILGYAFAAGMIFGGVQALVNLDMLYLDNLQWLGMALLMVLALHLWKTPLHIGPVADNDNIANKSFAAVLSRGAVTCAFDVRTLIFMLAISTQMGAAFMQQRNNFLPLAGLFIGLAALACTYQAIFAARIDRAFRKRSMRKIVPQNGKIMLISGRSVSAGFRKIAA